MIRFTSFARQAKAHCLGISFVTTLVFVLVILHFTPATLARFQRVQEHRWQTSAAGNKMGGSINDRPAFPGRDFPFQSHQPTTWQPSWVTLQGETNGELKRFTDFFYPITSTESFNTSSRIVASDGAAGDSFGNSIALSGDTLVVGAIYDNDSTNSRQGSAYVFVRTGTTWTQQAKLVANDLTFDNEFGHAVAIDGDTIIVGAIRAVSDSGVRTGAAYVFVRTGTNWSQQAKLTSNFVGGGEIFGKTVGLSGDTAVITDSARQDNDPLRTGAVHIFTRAGTTWTQQARLTSALPGGIGGAVLQNNTLLVNANLAPSYRGVIKVYERVGTSWLPQGEFTAVQAKQNSGFGGGAFQGDTVIAGALYDTVTEVQQGSAYVFVRNGTNWDYQTRLLPSDGALQNYFGASVAVHGNMALVGAPLANIGVTNNQGAVYVFVRTGTTWSQQGKLVASQGHAFSYFGSSVAFDGVWGAVGVPSDMVGQNNRQGSAYLFSDFIPCPSIALSPNSLPAADSSKDYAVHLTASGGTAPYAFRLASGTLPAGITLTGSGVLAGLATERGRFDLTLTVTDASGCVGTQSYSLIVAPSCPDLTLSPATLPEGATGTAYQQSLSVTGGSEAPTFRLLRGTLPFGITLSSAGTLAGVPSAYGEFVFTVQAKYTDSCVTQRTYALVINYQCTALSIAQADLPDSLVNTPYNVNLLPSGGVAPYSFALTSGNLPPGLVLTTSGSLSGTPSQPGGYALTITVTDSTGCTGARNFALLVRSPQVRAKKADFDGDGKADLSLWRGQTGGWLTLSSINDVLQITPWGAGYAPYFDVIVPGDYDGDGKTDRAIWRGQDTFWYIQLSATPNLPMLAYFGANYAPYFDTPTPGDFDGDGKTDIAVFRRNGTWFVRRSSDGVNQIAYFGQLGDIPLAADFDGDGKCDFGLFRPQATTNNWVILPSSTGNVVSFTWGGGYAPYFDTPVPADYDGDGKADLAIWRGQDSIWYVRPSANPSNSILNLWGANYAPYNDVPVPGDYDGDGKVDIAVWRPTSQVWYVLKSSDNAYIARQVGQAGDVPVPAYGVR